MAEQDEDICVDFLRHFQTRSVFKQSTKKAKQKSSGTAKAAAELSTERHGFTGKQQLGPATKYETTVNKQKKNCANARVGQLKKRKIDGEEDGCTGHTPAVQKQRVDKDFWPFEVDYNDHFETPLKAVQDIEPILLLLCKKLKKSKLNLAVYDPFFCQGGIRRHYEQLGLSNFIHRKCDFYKDVSSGSLPPYDIMVTNPPYSADHKERILEFCLRSRKPWALLLPNYVATKAYFSQLLESTSTPASQRPFFLTPAVRYSYDHPEGTGHAESPFFSIWYIGLGEHTEAVYGACKARLDSAAATGGPKRQGDSGGSGACGWDVSLARTVDALRQVGAVPTARRLNPKQRARLKQQKANALQSS